MPSMYHNEEREHTLTGRIMFRPEKMKIAKGWFRREERVVLTVQVEERYVNLWGPLPWPDDESKLELTTGTRWRELRWTDLLKPELEYLRERIG